LTRALRIDKLTLAALESTLLLYFDEKKAMEEIPTLRMLSLDTKWLKRRGKRLLKRLSGMAEQRLAVSLKEDVSQVGGGALPLQELPTIVVAVKPFDLSVNGLEEILRKGDPPIISRISKEELILDMRTIFDEEIPLLAGGIEKALMQIAKGKAHGEKEVGY
jgi:L-seryl-tRNA(Ser) seleniumtransferase